MKKTGKILVSATLSVILLTGCKPIEKVQNIFKSNKSVKYEYHYYDKDFNHTEELLTEYKNGKLVAVSYITLYDKITSKTYCEGSDHAELDKDTYTLTCKVDDNGALITRVVKMDKYDEFAEEYDQYANTEDEKTYTKLKTEDGAKEVFNKLKDEFKNEVEHSDEYNYLVIANEKYTW